MARDRAGVDRSPFNFMIPQVLFFVFLALTTVVAVWRDAEQRRARRLATAWNATNTLILGGLRRRRVA